MEGRNESIHQNLSIGDIKWTKKDFFPLHLIHLSKEKRGENLKIGTSSLREKGEGGVEKDWSLLPQNLGNDRSTVQSLMTALTVVETYHIDDLSQCQSESNVQWFRSVS